jgi:(p)ppGpp synthase/HD superfamily hydrolase
VSTAQPKQAEAPQDGDPLAKASMSVSARYGEALLWAEQIHRDQRRKGKAVPYISHLISVSALVWEDGGSEDQAIAALLHDAIEDAGQSHASIAERFGTAVADIVRDCTDTNGAPGGGEKEPWLLRKTRYIASLEHKPEASLLVTAADKAHNAGDMVLDARRDPSMWSKFNAGLEGSAWYLLRMHQQLNRRLSGSRSVERLGEAVSEVLASESYRRLVPEELAPAVWAAGYADRLAA